MVETRLCKLRGTSDTFVRMIKKKKKGCCCVVCNTYNTRCVLSILLLVVVLSVTRTMPGTYRRIDCRVYVRIHVFVSLVLLVFSLSLFLFLWYIIVVWCCVVVLGVHCCVVLLLAVFMSCIAVIFQTFTSSTRGCCP